ncbi:MAG: HD domain-containing protein [Ilumatobacteraceae bacterium]|nr:HD domain-containing protein [Ilumatobacteraceae bacterium]
MEPFDHDKVANAASYATLIHRQQSRKSIDNSKRPYISHLYDVASILISAGASSDEVCAGFLHDAIEDQGGNPQAENISRMFGSDIRTLVEGCTDSTSTNPINKLPWRERKEAYIKHFETASDSVRRVSCADKISNMRSIIADLEKSGNDIWNIFCRSIPYNGKKDALPIPERRKNTMWYHKSIGKVVDANRATIGELANLYKTTLAHLHIAADAAEARSN